MRLPSPVSILAALRDSKRWRKWALEALILFAIVGAVTLWQNRGLPAGDAAAVAKHLKERGIALSAVADESGVIAADWRVRGVPAHFILDPAGNIRFRVVGYATTLGLRARLWWAERFPA